MTVHVPGLTFPPLSELHWKSTAEAIRFRPATRPRELLTQGAVVREVGRRTLCLLSDPAAAHRVLRTESAAFPKARPQYRVGHQAFGPGLSGTIGAVNRNQRAAFRPLFGGATLKRVETVTAAAAAAAVQRWCTAEGPVDLHREASRLALDVAWSVLLGPGRPEPASDDVARAIEALAGMPKQDFVASAQVMHTLVDRFEESGRAACLPAENPLAGLADAAAPAAAGLGRDELRANAVVLAASGHVTTGLTLGWALWALGQLPEVQDGLRRRLQAGESVADDLVALFSEALRLWSPATETMREIPAGATLCGRDLPPGTLILVCLYALHRRPDAWPEPDRFDPGRFAAGRRGTLVEGAFQPFTAGDYRCPGSSLAWRELVTAAQAILLRARIEVAPGDAAAVGLEAGTCLYPDRPLRAHLTALA